MSAYSEEEIINKLAFILQGNAEFLCHLEELNTTRLIPLTRIGDYFVPDSLDLSE